MIHRTPLLTALLAAAAVTVHVVPGAATALQFDRAAFAAGEWWRVLTCHLTHFNLSHLAWDVGVLLVLGSWCEGQSRTRTLGALVLASVAIPAAIAAWQPQFETYRGLSGVDCALFGMAATQLLRHPDLRSRWLGAAALVAFAAKCIREMITASALFASDEGFAPVPLAHLIGLLAGAAAAVAPYPRWYRSTQERILRALTCPRQKPC